MNRANRNTLWAGIFVEELKKAGLEAVVLAPGSRSTPLALAFAESGLRIYVHSDERSAAYFGLGLARASGKPVALVCTSGTAAANFFPAVVEANTSEIPLLVLTADRPAELRESGANQTIDQVKLYGAHVRWAVDAPPPEANFSRHALRAWQSLAARAYETCLSPLPGVVQINFQFRKPLEAQEVAGDAPAWLDSAALEAAPARVTFSRPRLAPAAGQVDFLVRAVAAAPRGIIVAGPRCPGGEFPAALTAFAVRLGYPILADALSGLRFGAHINESVLGGYESFLDENAPRPQLILRFGDVPVGARLAAYLDRLEDVPQIHISEVKRWRDDQFRVTHSMWVEPLLLFQALTEVSAPAREDSWLAAWRALEESAWQKNARLCADPACEGGILPEVLEQLPAGGALFVANSLPVRHLDQFCRPQSKALTVFANRGASGIDGTLSSALGAAAQFPGLVFVTGDLSFYHDMNGLLAFSRCGVRATIVIINNDGGRIFERLPIAQYEPPLTELFVAPHGLTFEHAAKLYGLTYLQVTRTGLAAALAAGSEIIEVRASGINAGVQARDTAFMPESKPSTDINVGVQKRDMAFMPESKDVYYRRNLPHVHPVGHPFFITFRLADSLPMAVLADLKEQMVKELRAVKNNFSDERDTIIKKHFAHYDAWLDRCETGPRWLEDENIAGIVAEKLHSLDKERYKLVSYCLMPNHVHLLIEPITHEIASHHGTSAKYPLTEILRLIKGSTAYDCNLALGRTGRFWQQESYDRYVRDEQEFTRIIQYILNNPVKAGLAKGWKDWRYSYVSPEFGEW